MLLAADLTYTGMCAGGQQHPSTVTVFRPAGLFKWHVPVSALACCTAALAGHAVAKFDSVAGCAADECWNRALVFGSLSLFVAHVGDRKSVHEGLGQSPSSLEGVEMFGGMAQALLPSSGGPKASHHATALARAFAVASSMAFVWCCCGQLVVVGRQG